MFEARTLTAPAQTPRCITLPPSTPFHKQAVMRTVTLRVSVSTPAPPCMLHLELWRHHVLLAPAAAVLLLPPSMRGVAAELGEMCAHRSSGSSGGSNTLSSTTESQDPMHLATFVGDLGLWLEACRTQQHVSSSQVGKRGAGSDMRSDHMACARERVDLGPGGWLRVCGLK